VDTYPCPACGGVANDVDGCTSCGRAHDPVAATLARLNQAMASLQDETRRLAEDQSDLRARRQRLQAQRAALTKALAQRIAEESGATPKPRRTQPPTARPVTPPRTTAKQIKTTTSGKPTSATTSAEPINPTIPVQRGQVDPPAGAETSPRSAQNTLLSLGGVLVGIAIIAITWVIYTTAQTGGQAFILAIATTLALGIPVLLARRTLTATAETIAGLGLLLVLLDGYAAYSSDLAGLASVPAPLYAAVLFALVAGVAAAYRLATHLRAPQFAALLAVQPLLPLVGAHLGLGTDGFCFVFALVAAQNLGAVVLFSRDLNLARTAARPSTGSWPRMLRELAWVLFGVALAGAVALALLGEVRATSTREAVRTSLVLLLAAAVGVAGGQLSGRERLRHLSTAAAALAIVGAGSRVAALALPDYTLLVTAAIATAVAVSAGFLPVPARHGWQIGSLIGAAAAALVVVGSAIGTANAAVRAAINPNPWAADVLSYLDRVRTTSWQVPIAAVLLTVLAVASMPARYRIDAAVAGGLFVVLAAPGTGSLAWWAVPLLAAAASAVATFTALYATEGNGALVRSTSAALLGLYALATSLARPELTAAVCGLLALVAASTAVSAATWPERFGPYADRVADSAAGGAAFTLPITVGTIAWLGGAQSRVLLPVTLLATAIGVLGAALSQVAARMPRTASAGGALAAAVGCIGLSLIVDGTAPVDIALAVLLLMAALTTAASRAFEASPGGLVEDVASVPTAVSALIDSVDGEIDRPETRRRGPLPRRVDGTTLGAALGTAALIFALARLFSVAVPGIGLVTTTAMVVAVALVVVALPAAWRRGPRLGAGAVAGAIGLITAGIAVGEAVRTVAAATPFWAADLGGWQAKVTFWAPYGWQVPASLLLAAAAAWALVPPPNGGDVGFVALALAGLAAPAALDLVWWTPMLIAGCLALGIGVGAALVGPDDPTTVVHRRLGFAAILGLYATAAAGVGPGPTAVMLSVIVAAGVTVAAIAQIRSAQTAPPAGASGPLLGGAVDGGPVPIAAVSAVAGTAAGAALLAAPGAAATIAVASRSSNTGVLGAALTLAGFGVLVVFALRAAQVRWGAFPAFAVGAAALVVALASIPDLRHADPQGQLWAAAAALVAACAAATLPRPDRARRAARAGTYGGRPDDRTAIAVLGATAAPAALLAITASAPAWLTALVGPYGTLRQVWHGYPAAAVPQGARTAMLTLLLLTAVAAVTAVTLGGERYLLATTLPPLACLALVVPSAMGAPGQATSWVALGVALATGLGAALSPPTLPSAARMLRGTAGVVCAVTGATGLAGSLATRGGTLAALGVLLVAALTAAVLGRDPAVRMVAWLVASAAGFALPVAIFAAVGQPVRPAAFGVLAVCALLLATAAFLARTPFPRRSPAPSASPTPVDLGDIPAGGDPLTGASPKPAQAGGRVAEAGVVELAAALGATLALLLALGSARHAAAVLTIWGLLLGAAALRPDRPAIRRQWLVRGALAAELAACWLLLYSVEVGLPEAYTLPFAAVAVLTGAVELRRRPELSSWTAYGAALAGGFLPSLVLVLAGEDAVWRWVTLFAAAIVTVILGSWRRRRAPVVAGAGVAVAVAVTEMIRLLVQGAIAGAVLVAVAGLVLIVFGALSEQRLRSALGKMS
jgi:hypothetical protein